MGWERAFFGAPSLYRQGAQKKLYAFRAGWHVLAAGRKMMGSGIVLRAAAKCGVVLAAVCRQGVIIMPLSQIGKNFLTKTVAFDTKRRYLFFACFGAGLC